MVTGAPADAAVDLGFLFAQASHTLTTEATAALAGLGIPLRGYCVMSTALKGGLTQIRLAELCDLDKTTMVVTLDELEKAGLVERQACSTDRRARIVCVTQEGERVVAQAGQILSRLYEDVLSTVPPGDREVFVSCLTRLVEGRLSTPVPCERAPRRRAPRAP